MFACLARRMKDATWETISGFKLFNGHEKRKETFPLYRGEVMLCVWWLFEKNLTRKI